MKQQMTKLAFNLIERGFIPDQIIRKGIRALVKQRLEELNLSDKQYLNHHRQNFFEMMDQSEVAPLAHKANEQHYEVSSEFFGLVLGPQRKYSACYWDHAKNLEEAENDALEITSSRAMLENGQSILELGCGWGSLTLWMAKHYPASQITALSNSHSQRAYIEAEAARNQIDNIRIVTCDMNDFHIDQQFDRVVSVEMFEHMRNYRVLFDRISSWLKTEGLFFMHIFCHQAAPYEFADRDASDWMSRYFFSGGIMPSYDLPLQFQDSLKIRDQWAWDGTHYQKTAEAWVDNMQNYQTEIMRVLDHTYGEKEAYIWWTRWRMFFMACAELFGYESGEQWQVGHYLFEQSST